MTGIKRASLAPVYNSRENYSRRTLSKRKILSILPMGVQIDR